MAAPPTVSLRERKKLQTRQTIYRAALTLFSENGYQETTIAQIAEAADVSPRTVSTYFPAKEDLVFGARGEVKERLRDAILARPKGENTMDALRTWLMSERSLWEDREAEAACQRLIISSDEQLLAYEQAEIREMAGLLAEGLAQDLNREPDDIEPRMAASAAVAVFGMLSMDVKHAPDPGPMPSLEEQMVILDQALTFITGGVTALLEARES